MLFNRPEESAAFRKRLNHIIIMSGKSVRAYAMDAGLNPSTLQKYVEGSREPDLLNILVLCKHYGTSLDWLCGLSDSQDLQDDKPKRMFEAYSSASPQDKGIIELLLSKTGYQK